MSKRSSWSKGAEKLRVLKDGSADLGPGLLLRVLLFAAAVPILMRLKLTTLQRLLESSRKPPSGSPAESAKIIAHVDRILGATRPFVSGGCLTRGLTLFYFLRRAGVEVHLCFGTGTPVGQAFAGHCWLEMDGRPFLEDSDPRPVFAESYRLPLVGSIASG